MAKTGSSFNTPGAVLQCSTSLHGGLEMSLRGFHLPAPAVELGELGDTVDRRIEQYGYQGNLAGPEPRRADAVPDFSEYQGLWQGRQRLLHEPRWASLWLQPGRELVMEAYRCEPA
jgi:hypothetical protein